MKFMMFVMGNDDYQSGKPPSPALMAAIEKLAVEARAAGKLLSSEGLKPQATRIRLTNGRRHVIDGPFTETKELVGGYAIFEVESKEEAMRHAQRFVDAHVEAGVRNFEMELRPMFGPEDFGACNEHLQGARVTA
jgi:hypothetical protein